MVFTLADLVDDPTLKLSVLSARDRLDVEVVAAHVSELVRPQGWLQGGELLMTIGLLLETDLRACRRYVANVQEAGVCALAIGLGRDLPHQRSPRSLVRAAEDAGLPLLEVPDGVPFIAVTKAVFAAKALAQRQALEQAVRLHRRLTVAATSGHGLDAILQTWSAETGTSVAVTDTAGRLLAAAGHPPVALDADVVRLVDEVVGHGLRGSGMSERQGVGVEVQPLGARRVRGTAVLSGQRLADLHVSVPALVSLLSLELERRHLAGEPERRRRAAVLGRLLQGRADAARAQEMLAAAGLVSPSVRVVAVGSVEEGSTPLPDLVADLAPAVRGGLVRLHQGVVEAVVGDDVDVPVLLERFAPGHPAGVGAEVTADALPVSQRQARSLVEVSRRRGRPVVESESRSAQFLLELGDRGALQGFADSVLAPVDASSSAQTLLRTLRVWLEMQGSWDGTASRLRVHRHTVRNRIDRIGVLTGRAMDRPADQMDLWLALHARDVAGGASG